MDAERVVVEILAKVDGFDGKVRQSANAFAGGMKQIESSATRAEGAVGRSMTTIERSAGAARQATRNLGYQISDISTQLSGGASPFLVLAQQGPQVANALDGAKGAVGKFATFLSGPYGAAILGAVTLMGVFLSKNKESADTVDDLVEKLKKKAKQDDLSRVATEAYTHSIEGQTEAYRKLNDEITNNIKGERTRAKEQISSIKADQKKNFSAYDRAKAERDAARASLERAKAYVPNAADPAQAAAEYAGQLALAQRRFDTANAKVKALAGTIVAADQAVRDLTITIKDMDADALADPISAINQKYEQMEEAAKLAAKGNDKLAASLDKTLAGIRKNKQAEIEREQAKHRTSSSGLRGNEVSASEAAAIARSAGLQVNSTNRSYADQKRLYDAWVAQGMPKDNPVARPGTSAHEGANGRWALDIQFGKGVTPELLRKVFADQGVNLSKIIKERGHFHIEGSTAGADKANSDAARAAQAEAARQERQQGILGSLQERYAAALAKLAQGTEESADAQKAAIEAQRVELDRKLDADAKLDPEIRAKAKDLNDATAKLAAEIVDRAEAERQFRIKAEQRERDLTVAEALNQQQQEQLQLQSGLARSQAERRDIELRILKLAIEEERLRAQAVIAARDALKAELDKKGVDKLTDADRKALADANAQATIAQGTLSALPGKQSMQTAGILQQTAGPLQQLFNSLPQSAQEISEAFEAIAAHGLDALADSITDVITGSKSLGEAFRGVAQSIIRDIIAMTVKMLIFRAISSAIGFSGGGSIGSGAGAVGSAASGSNVGAALFKASGGAIFGRGSGTSDSIPAWLSNGEYVVKAKAVKALGIPFLDAINKGKLPHFSDGGLVSAISPANIPARGAMTGLTVVQQFTLDARHGITTPELLRHVNTVASEKAAQAGRTAYDASRRALPKQIGNFQKLGTT